MFSLNPSSSTTTIAGANEALWRNAITSVWRCHHVQTCSQPETAPCALLPAKD
jgi:hypothetical protein